MKKIIIEKLQNYTYYMERLAEVIEELESICFKTTANYGDLSGVTGSGFSSKVEKYGDRIYALHIKERRLQKKITEIKSLIECSGLDDKEKGVMWWIAKNGSLQAYARREHIGRDNVYKIRDRAIKKIIEKHKLQNVG